MAYKGKKKLRVGGRNESGEQSLLLPIFINSINDNDNNVCRRGF